MKNPGFQSASVEALRAALEREKTLLDELNDRIAIEACIFRILSCERRLSLMNLGMKLPSPPNSKKKER